MASFSTGAKMTLNPRLVFKHISSQILALVLSMFVYVIYQSVWPHSSPMTVDVSNMQVVSDSYGTKLQWNCNTKIHRQFNGSIHRQLEKRDGSETVSLPSSSFRLSPADKQTPIKALAIPSNLTPGEWCLTTKLTWYETLSLRESNMKGMETCFSVPETKPSTLLELIGRVNALEAELQSHAIVDFTDHSTMKGTK